MLKTIRKLGVPYAVLLIIAFALALAQAVGLQDRILAPMPTYQGDGNYDDTSYWAGPFRVRGYTINMPSFDLGKPWKASYTTKGLVKIGRTFRVCLAIRDGQRRFLSKGERDRLSAAIEIEVATASGDVVFLSTGKLRDYTWAGSAGVFFLFADREEDSFTPDPTQTYRIRVNYNGEPALRNTCGFILIRSGGTI